MEELLKVKEVILIILANIIIMIILFIAIIVIRASILMKQLFSILKLKDIMDINYF